MSALNKKVNTNSGGAVYRPADGMYRGVFRGHEDAGAMPSAYSDQPREKVRFLFELHTFVPGGDGQPVINPETGETAVYGALVNASTHIKSSAYQYALIITGEQTLEEADDLGEELDKGIGNEVLLQFGPGKQSGKSGSLLAVLPLIRG
jgi:hypothetical protein